MSKNTGNKNYLQRDLRATTDEAGGHGRVGAAGLQQHPLAGEEAEHVSARAQTLHALLVLLVTLARRGCNDAMK